VDQDAVTNSHSKQAAKQPNGLLKGHLAYIAKAKAHSEDQGESPTKCFQSTHLTPMREGGAFGDLRKIGHMISSLG
jgi:hypothetical protein